MLSEKEITEIGTATAVTTAMMFLGIVEPEGKVEIGDEEMKKYDALVGKFLSKPPKGDIRDAFKKASNWDELVAFASLLGSTIAPLTSDYLEFIDALTSQLTVRDVNKKFKVKLSREEYFGKLVKVSLSIAKANGLKDIVRKVNSYSSDVERFFGILYTSYILTKSAIESRAELIAEALVTSILKNAQIGLPSRGDDGNIYV